LKTKILEGQLGRTREEIIGRKRKLHNKELKNSTLHLLFQGDEVGGTCSTYEKYENV
jgi:hypothetical protein